MAEPRVKFFGRVKGGALHFYKPAMFQEFVSHLENKEFEVTLQERFYETTHDQHGYYRAGIIKHTCMQTEIFGGWLESEIHGFFTGLFLSYTKMMAGKEVKFIESTGTLGKKKMTEYIEKVINWLSQHEIYVLTPEEYYAGKYASR